MGTRRQSQTFDYGRALPGSAIEKGRHRTFVGGKWDQLGELQLAFLISRGLRPEHRLLDVGCGSLRAGVKLVDYLKPGNYYAIDINESLIEAGYERELTDDQRARLPRDHLRATRRFECDFGVTFDFAIAQSVFTHVSWNHIRLCLFQLSKVMSPGARFYATFYEAPPTYPVDGVRGGKLTTEHNPFFYYRADLATAARHLPWRARYLGQWGHPSGQRMMQFSRVAVSPGGLLRAKETRARLRRVPGAHKAVQVLRRAAGR